MNVRAGRGAFSRTGVRASSGSGSNPMRSLPSRLENKVSLGFVEGLNNKIRVIQRRAYGLRNEQYLRLKILT